MKMKDSQTKKRKKKKKIPFTIGMSAFFLSSLSLSPLRISFSLFLGEQSANEN